MSAAAGYRRDVDGLRAVAVAAIVAYHAFPGLLPGGFVGVDVFFVISGFLITGIIARQRDAGTFSWGGFYLRRARRILPALLVVVLVTAALAALIELPRQLMLSGAAMAASAIFAANLFFGTSQGYFAPGPQLNAFLHLWSLGVEEQFYLLWPALIPALSWRRLKPARPWLAILLLAASLAAAQSMLAAGAANWAFFSLPSRAWEFLAGGALSLGLVRPPGRRAAEAAAAGGLLLIAGSVAFLSEQTPFPGIAAAPACLGTALVLWSGLAGAPAAAAPLRAGPVVGLGRASYSVYLWHWPLLVLARDAVQGPLGVWPRLALVAAALGLAVLSWRFVEEPWRRGPAARPWRLAGVLAAASLVTFAAGAVFYATGGLPRRLSPDVRALAALETTDVNPLRHACFEQPGPIAPGGCRIGAAAEARDYDVLVWGDSHADAVTPGVVAWAQARRWSVREAARGGCPPLAGVTLRVGVRRRPDCAATTQAVLGEIAADPKLKLVVLAARWPLYRDAPPFYDPNSPRVTMTPNTLAAPLGQTLDAIRARAPQAQVVVIGPVPELTITPPQCLAQARHLRQPQAWCWRVPAATPSVRFEPAEAEIAQALAPRPWARVVYPSQALCEGGWCAAALDGRPIYFDDDHLSASGARRLVPGWLEAALAGPAQARLKPSSLQASLPTPWWTVKSPSGS
jgi:peptidoglycan/LPS O-acetylase OafA/YrhL